MSQSAWALQLPSHTGTGWRKLRKAIKRATSRKTRHEGKVMHEDAPIRSTKGWAD